MSLWTLMLSIVLRTRVLRGCCVEHVVVVLLFAVLRNEWVRVGSVDLLSVVLRLELLLLRPVELLGIKGLRVVELLLWHVLGVVVDGSELLLVLRLVLARVEFLGDLREINRLLGLRDEFLRRHLRHVFRVVLELLVLLAAAFVLPEVIILTVHLVVLQVRAPLVVVIFSILPFPALVAVLKIVVFSVLTPVLVLILCLLSVLSRVVVLLAVVVAWISFVIPPLLILELESAATSNGFIFGHIWFAVLTVEVVAFS